MQAWQLRVEHLLCPRTGAGCSGYISEQDRGPYPKELILLGRSYLSHVSLVSLFLIMWDLELCQSCGHVPEICTYV